MTDISEKKALLRKRLRAERAKITDHGERSRRACARLSRVPGWARARNVLIYVGYRSELATESLIQAILNDSSKRCVAPRCLADGRLKLVEIRSWAELAPGAYGIREPRLEPSVLAERILTPEQIDFAVLPGVGFDEKGRRLGQGGGYYDRLLPDLRPEIPTVGLAFERQIAPEICAEGHDRRVKYVATEERIIPTRTPLVWGIVGGIACGKSLVSNFFRENGVPVFDADKFGHSLYEKTEIRQALTERWGESLLTTDGGMDRKKIAQIVFASHDELRFLNQLFHPLIHQGWRDFLDRARREEKKVAILDAALLLETGWQKECDGILCVEAPRDAQIRFAMQRGWTLEELEARERNQKSILEKRKEADLRVANTGNAEILPLLKETLQFVNMDFQD